jgi:hypothetical protein
MQFNDKKQNLHYDVKEKGQQSTKYDMISTHYNFPHRRTISDLWDIIY